MNDFGSFRDQMNFIMKLYMRKSLKKTMAKAPHAGSRKYIAEFIHDKFLKNSSQYKVIQPQALAFFNGTYWWVAKIVTIDRATNNIGIARKAEVGFCYCVRDQERDTSKWKELICKKTLPVKQTKSLVKKTEDVVKVERKRR